MEKVGQRTVERCHRRAQDADFAATLPARDAALLRGVVAPARSMPAAGKRVTLAAPGALETADTSGLRVCNVNCVMSHGRIAARHAQKFTETTAGGSDQHPVIAHH